VISVGADVIVEVALRHEPQERARIVRER